MELVIAAIVVQLLIVGAFARAYHVVSTEADVLRARIEENAVASSLAFDYVTKDIANVRLVRDSMDEEIRNRQGAYDMAQRLIRRQGRALAEHIESNLH